MSCSNCGSLGGNECPKCFADYCDNCWYVEKQNDVWRCSDPFKVNCEQVEHHITLEEYSEVQKYEKMEKDAKTYGSDHYFESSNDF